MTAKAAGMVSDPEHFYMCSVSCLPTVTGKLFEFQNLERSIGQSIAEAKAAKSQSELARTSLFAIRLVKITCDATVAIMGELLSPSRKIPLFGKLAPAKMISAAYSGLTPLADLGGKSIAGSTTATDWTKAATGAAMGAVKVIAPSSTGRDLVELKKLQSDIVVDGMNMDMNAVMKDIGNNLVVIGKMAAKYADNEIYGNFIGAGKSIIYAGLDYVKAYKEYKSNDMTDQLDGVEKFLTTKLGQVRQSISSLQKMILDWETEQAQALSDSEKKMSSPCPAVDDR